MRKKVSLAVRKASEPTWGEMGSRFDSLAVFRLRLLNRAFWNVVLLPFRIIGWIISVIWRAMQNN